MRSDLGFIGGVFAFFMSWFKWHSVLYGILHFFCGWFYVIYYVFTYGFPHIPR